MSALYREDFLSIEEAEARYHKVRKMYESMKKRYSDGFSFYGTSLCNQDRLVFKACIDTLITLSRQDAVQENMLRSQQGECTVPLFDRIGWLQGSILLYVAAAQDLLK